jgi:hypothetical protein
LIKMCISGSACIGKRLNGLDQRAKATRKAGSAPVLARPASPAPKVSRRLVVATLAAASRQAPALGGFAEALRTAAAMP